jgi:two-component system, OmpR family, alkaline phosphatase synthesis response regulator PhoP
MKKKILIIDDEKDFVKMVALRIQSSGYEVITAFEGLDGLEKARKEKPDLILLDFMLPKMEGGQICRMLKFDDAYKSIPIIILTARSQKQDEEFASEVGANAYLKKPFEPEILLGKIKELLGE